MSTQENLPVVHQEATVANLSAGTNHVGGGGASALDGHRAWCPDNLEREVRRLRLLRVFSSRLASVRAVGEFFKAVHELMAEHQDVLGVNRTGLFLYIQEANALVAEENVDLENPQRIQTMTLQQAGYSISGLAVSEKRAIVVNDVRKSDIIPAAVAAKMNLKSSMSVPLRASDAIIGVMRVDNLERYDAFGQEEVDFFTMLGEQMGIVLENARLFSEAQRHSAALRRSEENVRKAFQAKHHQMEEISKVQAEFLPLQFENFAGLSFAANCRPCADVGGDFYCVVQLKDGRVAIAIGDVSGHGAKATITTATARALLTAALRELSPEEGPGRALYKANVWFEGQLDPEHFVTLWLGIWNPETEELTYAAQAHPHSVLCRVGEPSAYLDHEPSFPLGLAMVQPEPPKEYSVELQVGDRVIAYTDGWVESPSTDGKTLEGQAFLDFIDEADGMDVSQLPLVFFMNFERHAANTRIRDDITMIAFGRYE